jgi:hypothetical protein
MYVIALERTAESLVPLVRKGVWNRKRSDPIVHYSAFRLRISSPRQLLWANSGLILTLCSPVLAPGCVHYVDLGSVAQWYRGIQVKVRWGWQVWFGPGHP